MSQNPVLHHLDRNDMRRLRKACSTSDPRQLEAVDQNGNTALLKACYLGNSEAIRILLSHRANLLAINYFGQNALTLATYAGCCDSVCELLKHRSYNDFTLSSMIPPLCVAVLRGHQHLVELFQHLHPDGSAIQTVHGLTAAELEIMRSTHRRAN